MPIFFVISPFARLLNKPIDVGIGPEPLINNVYHKVALMRHGYSAETFVMDLYYITSEFDRTFVSANFVKREILHVSLLLSVLFRYKCLYIYFNGGPLGLGGFLWRFEALLFKLAGVKVVIMPYGGDVQDMALSPNLNLKHAYSQQYKSAIVRRKTVAAKVDYWSRHADHIIAGCDWVHYMHVWDTLMLAHFSIDTEKWKSARRSQTGETFRILHAPNHRYIKGTQYFIDAVEELRAEGLDVELVLLEGVGNDEIRARMEEVDVIADQLIVGWYAMFALEGMAMGKPVMCYLREDLKELYVTAGLVKPDEIPIVDCRPENVEETIRRLYENRRDVNEIGRRSRAFVERHHSLEAVGAVFDRINRTIGVMPSAESPGGIARADERSQ